MHNIIVTMFLREKQVIASLSCQSDLNMKSNLVIKQ